MKLIIGLGNPGNEFKNTRHNIGEIILNSWIKEKDFSPFKLNKKLQSLISINSLNKEKIILAFPQTFMNNSGLAVSKIKKLYKIIPDNLWVIHDEIDLPFGKIKISKDKNAAGHNGVKSIIDHLKTKDFIRFRVGIKNEFTDKAEDFVLAKFNSEEKESLKEIIKKASQALELTLAEGLNRAMTEIN